MQDYFFEFHFCPRCGKKYKKGSLTRKSATLLVCAPCGLKFFQSSTSATAAIIPKKNDPENVLLTTRAMDPGKNFLDLPGGFLEYHENPEQGVRREVREELGLNIKISRLFYADIGKYAYENVYHSVVSLFYITEPIVKSPEKYQKSEIKKCQFYNIRKLLEKEKRLFFVPDRIALKKYTSIIAAMLTVILAFTGCAQQNDAVNTAGSGANSNTIVKDEDGFPKIMRGVYGSVAIQSGNCMPTVCTQPPCATSCASEPSATKITVRAPATQKNMNVATLTEPTELILETASDGSGKFEIALPNGSYSIFAENNGVEYCNSFASQGEACQVTVKDDLTEFNITIDRATY